MSSKVIEGEAPETDDEEEDQELVEKLKSKPRKVVHVDERVVQGWKRLSSDTRTVVHRRSIPAQKIAEEQRNLTHSSFSSIQAASGFIRTASNNVNRIEDSLKDIKEAASLFPEKLENTVDIMKIQ